MKPEAAVEIFMARARAADGSFTEESVRAALNEMARVVGTVAHTSARIICQLMLAVGVDMGTTCQCTACTSVAKAGLAGMEFCEAVVNALGRQGSIASVLGAVDPHDHGHQIAPDRRANPPS